MEIALYMSKRSNWLGLRALQGKWSLRNICSTGKNSVAPYAEVMRATDVFGNGDFFVVFVRE